MDEGGGGGLSPTSCWGALVVGGLHEARARTFPPSSSQLEVAAAGLTEAFAEDDKREREREEKRRKSVELIRVRDNTPTKYGGVRYRRNGLRRVTEGVGQGRERPLSTYARGW